MIEIVSSKQLDQLASLLKRAASRSISLDADLINQVSAIIKDVRIRGDEALVEYTARFDGFITTPSDLKVKTETLRKLAAAVEPSVRQALRAAITRVRRFHECERQTSWEIEEANNVRLGQRIFPLAHVGSYIPGGSASYPSSVVMNVVPAQVAGVEHIVIATPPRTLQENPAVAAALVELGVFDVYAVGGAQAIAALAFGTETVPRVDKITGPGNRFVAAAKKLVFGAVGIDSIAGPTEIVIIADQTAKPAFVAADLLAQAEHARDASALLITSSRDLSEAVTVEIKKQIAGLARQEIIEESLSKYGAIIIVKDMDEACDLVNQLAPEHLEIMASEAETISSRIRHAGAIFFGDYSPEAVGDYLAGPNHVLPTSGTARFSSPLGVYDFVKRTNTVRFTATELKRTAEDIATLARAEGLEAHARSALIRNES